MDENRLIRVGKLFIRAMEWDPKLTVDLADGWVNFVERVVARDREQADQIVKLQEKIRELRQFEKLVIAARKRDGMRRKRATQKKGRNTK